MPRLFSSDMNNHLKKLFLIIAFFLVLTGSLAFLNLYYYSNKRSTNDHVVNVIIPRGSSVKKIGKLLEDKQLIKHPKLFFVAHRLFFKKLPLQAGEYEVLPYSSVKEIILMMNKGLVMQHKFTITEGKLTKEVINQVLAEKMLFGEITKEFNEGDFISDTYYFSYGETKMMLLERIYKHSQELIDKEWIARSANLPLKNKYEAVILASIVEKETGVNEERARVAAVFINRLRKGMKLQADPTVAYAVTQGKFILNRPLSLKDLKIKSLYNSYLYLGLPPTPITNPGILSLKATLNPLVTNELYFVVDGKGGHNFSTNLNQHNINVNNYRNLKKEKQ